MIVKEIKGSILDAPQLFIAHGVNCQNKMGSGVAKVLFENHPKIKTQYHEFCDYVTKEYSSTELLGMADPVICETKIIFNCFTQFKYGYDGSLYLNYEALEECLSEVVERMRYIGGKELAIPKIGCGLAGGDWEKVKKIINEQTSDIIDVYVYYL